MEWKQRCVGLGSEAVVIVDVVEIEAIVVVEIVVGLRLET